MRPTIGGDGDSWIAARFLHEEMGEHALAPNARVRGTFSCGSI
jgi:hypothetical protein